MKKFIFISAALAVAFIFTFALGACQKTPAENEGSDSSAPDASSAVTSDSESAEEPLFSQLKLVASVKVGEDILYKDGIEYRIAGPRAYCINEKGEIYLVSDYEDKIIRMNDTKTLPLNSNNIDADDIICIGDKIYVLDYSNIIYEYNIDNGYIDEYKLLADLTPNDNRYMREVEGKLCLFYKDSKNIILNNNEFIETDYHLPRSGSSSNSFIFNDKLKVLNFNNKTTSYLGCDETGFYIYELEHAPNGDNSYFESAVRKYDYDGNVTQYAIFDCNDCVSYPHHPVLYVNGDIYFMKRKAKTVDIYKVTLGNADVSRFSD